MSCRYVTLLGITNWVKSGTELSQVLNIEGGNVFVVDYQLFYVFKWFFFVIGMDKVEKMLHLCDPKSG